MDFNPPSFHSLTKEPLTGRLLEVTSGGKQDILLLLFGPQRKTSVLLKGDPETQSTYFFSPAP